VERGADLRRHRLRRHLAHRRPRRGDPRVLWLEQVRPGRFVTHVLEEQLTQAGGMVVADLDGDGQNELVVTGYDANVIYVYRREVP
jgi:hypothetical protein